jgi:dipeptidyl aminopeptidase/acylaminoacyl peptidase
VLELPGGPVRALDFGPGADQLAGASAGGIAVVWGLGDGRPRHTLLLEGLPNTVAWSPDGDTIAVAGESTATQLWDVGTGQLRTRLAGHGARVNDVAFDASGARLATVGDDGEINVWDASDGALLVRRHHPTWVYRVAFSPDGAHLLATSTRGAPFVVYLIGREMVETAQARTTRGMTASECLRFVRPFADCSRERERCPAGTAAGPRPDRATAPPTVAHGCGAVSALRPSWCWSSRHS